MRELTFEEKQGVNGGLLPLAATLAFVWYQAPHIQSFFEGYMEGAGSVVSE